MTNRAWREGYCDALFNRPSANPYTFINYYKMRAYNFGYVAGQQKARLLGINYVLNGAPNA